MTKNKVAFITGANRGIGFETARELGKKGITVVLGCRDKGKGDEAVQKLKAKGIENALVFSFDIDKMDDHKKVYDCLEKKFGKLDILINNAGILLERTDKDPLGSTFTSQEILRRTFDSNFFNLVALTQTLLPLLHKSPAGRIVNLSSILGSLTVLSDPHSSIHESKTFAYGASKSALNAFTVNLAQELKGTKIKVNSAHPGWVKTDMGGQEAPIELEDGAKTSVRLALLADDGPTGGFFHLDEKVPW